MQRVPEDCPFRSDVQRLEGNEIGKCELIERWFPETPAAALVRRSACEQCCLSAPPEPDQINDVIASHLYLLAERGLAASPANGGRAVDRARARALATSALKTVWGTPNTTQWAGHVYNLPSTADVIDAVVDPDTFARHLRIREPFAYLRYGDGEWFSILGHLGRNDDGHDFFPETLGTELKWTFEYAAGLWPRNSRFYMGLHGRHGIILEDAIRRYLIENGIAYRIHWVGDNLFARGVRDFSTLRFLEAVKDFSGPKTLVGNRSLSPVAAGLGCRHVVIPRIDCHREMDRIYRESRFTGPGLLICCAGMASEGLICKVHEQNPAGSYVDCGSIFDSLVGRLTRNYTQRNWNGILDVLLEHYAPLVLKRPKPQGHVG